jgi:hypothetical protein
VGASSGDCKRSAKSRRNKNRAATKAYEMKLKSFGASFTRSKSSRPQHTGFVAVVAGLLCALAGAVFCGGAWAVEEDGAPVNVYMTGAEVRIDRAVEGDLTAAAGRIHVDQPIGGDAMLGAGSIDVQAPVTEDLRAAGGIVTVASRVGGTVLIAAGRIILTSAAETHGETWLAAGIVSLDGRARSGVKIYAREVSLQGEMFGPLDISSDSIQIKSGARIYGDVTYSGANEITIDPLAQVAGKVTRTGGNRAGREPAANIPGLKPLRPLLIAALLAAGILLHALFPRFTASAVTTLRAAPAKSLGLGTALFFSVPPVAVLLVITIIGIPLALALALAYVVALLGGYLVMAFFVAAKLGDALHRHALIGWRRYAFFAGALLLLALATSIPYIGVVVVVAATAGGLGAMVLQRFSRHVTATPAAQGRDTWPAA